MLAQKYYDLVIVRDYSSAEHLLSSPDLSEALQLPQSVSTRRLRDHNGDVDSVSLHQRESWQRHGDDRVWRHRHRHEKLSLSSSKSLPYLVQYIVLASNYPDVRFLPNSLLLVERLKFFHRVRLARLQSSLLSRPGRLESGRRRLGIVLAGPTLLCLNPSLPLKISQNLVNLRVGDSSGLAKFASRLGA